METRITPSTLWKRTKEYVGHFVSESATPTRFYEVANEVYLEMSFLLPDDVRDQPRDLRNGT